MRVLSVSDAAFGEVIAVAPCRFLLRTASGEFWRGISAAFTVGGGRVTLVRNEDSVKRSVVSE